MSTRHEWAEWHLTPHGWEVGTRKWDHGKEPGETPIDLVLTCRFHDEFDSLALSGSEHNRYIEQVWRSENDADVEALVSEHGRCPYRFT